MKMDIQEKIKRNIYSYLKKRNKSLDGLFFKNPENFFKVHDHLEPYHDNIELVVLHEGSDVSKFFNWAYRCNDEIERMKKVLSKLDCKISQYESWYSVIYRDHCEKKKLLAMGCPEEDLHLYLKGRK